ncbi:MAG: formylglycine-generating enzyme family protein [Candidatus Sumerlaeota bacterium]|nr:formylglycine-generating enzyme family protein [Candidatus Sumerlaeota bacterium]
MKNFWIVFFASCAAFLAPHPFAPWAAPPAAPNSAAPATTCAALEWYVMPLAGGMPQTLGAAVKDSAQPMVIYVFTQDTPKAAEALAELAGLPPSQYRGIAVALGVESERAGIAQWVARLSLPPTLPVYLAQAPAAQTTVLPLIILCSPDGVELRRQRGWSKGIRKMMTLADTPVPIASAAGAPKNAGPPPAAGSPAVPGIPAGAAASSATVASLPKTTSSLMVDLLNALDAPPTKTAFLALREGENYEEALGNGVKLKMIRIKGGTFEMGSPASEIGRYNNEGPQHKVELDGFWMGETEVTQAQFLVVMRKHSSQWKSADFPAGQVSWEDAAKFCEALTTRTNFLNLAYRLPTEAQWEYACRAGSKAKFWFGNIDSDLAAFDWVAPDSNGTPHPVKTRRANPWGLFDMYGNVSEWCLDWYADSYAGGNQKNPGGPDTGMERVIRGGSASDSASRCRSAKRNRSFSSMSYSITGFRVTASLTKN